MLLRTVKSCGPDASTPASSFAEACRPDRARTKLYSRDDGDKKARSPGRSRSKPLKPLRVGMPGDPGEPRGDYARVLSIFCTRGCGCIVRPAFPTPSGAKDLWNNSGALRRGIAGAHRKFERRAGAP